MIYALPVYVNTDLLSNPDCESVQSHAVRVELGNSLGSEQRTSLKKYINKRGEKEEEASESHKRLCHVVLCMRICM